MMVYESSKKATLLFGGADLTGLFGDTWRMKNGACIKVQDMGPVRNRSKNNKDGQ
ncbi:MAG TPA: hypothetical protein VH415_00060 [Nitrososphaeraceae archaeon]